MWKRCSSVGYVTGIGVRTNLQPVGLDLCVVVLVGACCLEDPSIRCAGIAGAPGAVISHRQDSDE